MAEETNVQALFLGPKSENRKFFREMLDFVIDEHIHWRRDFHPSDKAVVSPKEQRCSDYQDTLMRTEEALLELSSRLKAGSVPAFSPRYIGHMLSDTLMAANLGYLATILYNPNNCSYDASSASTELELEVGRDLAKMFGYRQEHSWGHITAGGTIANFEGLWMARNLKSLGLAIEQWNPELLERFDQRQRRNLPVETVLDLLTEVKAAGDLDAVRRHTVQYRGADPALGKLLVPQSKHYSWVKAVDILGLGQDCMVEVPVRSDFRMDVDALSRIVRDLVDRGEPILGVVAVLGTTEMGAVDEIHRIVELRKELEASGTGFYLHLDAAYGGYARAIFLDEDSRVVPKEHLSRRLHAARAVSAQVDWPSDSVYEAFRATHECDSITVDPHKLGYVPYSAGGIVIRDRRVLDLISYFASYVFEPSEIGPQMLGSFIMEGSKPGASAASVWMAHRVVPLSMKGYGKLIGNSIEGAQRLYRAFGQYGEITVEDREFSLIPVAKPDLNLVDFVVVERSAPGGLEEVNRLNRFVYEQCSYRAGPVYLEDFLLSKTVLDVSTYGDALLALLDRLGLAQDEGDGEGDGELSLFVLRATLMTPYLTSNQTFEEYRLTFWEALHNHIRRFVLEERRPESVAGIG